MSEISEIVNKGIPISTPINILYNDLNVLTKTVGLTGSQQRAGMVEAGAIMV